MNELFEFNAYDMQKLAAKNACHIGDHLDVHTIQKIVPGHFMQYKNMLFKREVDSGSRVNIKS